MSALYNVNNTDQIWLESYTRFIFHKHSLLDKYYLKAKQAKNYKITTSSWFYRVWKSIIILVQCLCCAKKRQWQALWVNTYFSLIYLKSFYSKQNILAFMFLKLLTLINILVNLKVNMNFIFDGVIVRHIYKVKCKTAILLYNLSLLYTFWFSNL